MPRPLPLVAFSHLRWDLVLQRPQHLLARFAARGRAVLVVEEPVTGGTRWELRVGAPGVLVARPHLAAPAAGFGDPRLPSMTRALLARRGITAHVGWSWTPMAAALLARLDPTVVAYDCMDELSAFAGAPPDLPERERDLLAMADVVFTGGPSLYRAKRDRHARVHCFPSSVDAAHFASAARLAEAPDQAPLPHPRLGFYGVIDERFDAPLLAALADARPAWQIVIVGPVLKIDRARLPRRPNLHWLGPRAYDALPSYLAGWDVCLLPFARNRATRFISPTKTLEYMAAGRPIVSTPIPDVAEPYGDVVHLGDGAPAFVAACEAALGCASAESCRRAERAAAVVAATSWDRTVDAMDRLVVEAELRAAAREAAEHGGRA
jgi:UDP-galactopyranose mutase